MYDHIVYLLVILGIIHIFCIENYLLGLLVRGECMGLRIFSAFLTFFHVWREQGKVGSVLGCLEAFWELEWLLYLVFGREFYTIFIFVANNVFYA